MSCFFNYFKKSRVLYDFFFYHFLFGIKRYISTIHGEKKIWCRKRSEGNELCYIFQKSNITHSQYHDCTNIIEFAKYHPFFFLLYNIIHHLFTKMRYWKKTRTQIFFLSLKDQNKTHLNISIMKKTFKLCYLYVKTQFAYTIIIFASFFY